MVSFHLSIIPIKCVSLNNLLLKTWSTFGFCSKPIYVESINPWPSFHHWYIHSPMVDIKLWHINLRVGREDEKGGGNVCQRRHKAWLEERNQLDVQLKETLFFFSINNRKRTLTKLEELLCLRSHGVIVSVKIIKFYRKYTYH